MRKNHVAKLIFTAIIGIALALSVFAGCKNTAGTTKYFTVDFDSNGGSSVASQTIESGKTVTEPTDPERSGYDFIGWFENGSTSEYDFSTAVTKDFTLYASWTKKTDTEPEKPVTFTVRFLDGSLDGAEYKTETVESGKTVTKPADPVKTGYTFNGWTLSDGSAFDFNTAITANTTLIAKWTKNQTTEPEKPVTFTVKFMDGTSEYETETVESGKTATRPADPVKTGYAFNGWTYSDGAAFNFNTAITADITLYAKWTKNPPVEPETKYYTVTFNSNQGSSVFAQYVESGKKAAEPAAPEKSGFIFSGWYKESALTNLYDFDTAVTADITLHAKWVNDNVTTYTVSFESDGGSKVLAQEIVTGGKAVFPAAPEKENFVFSGWYIGEDLYNFNTPVTADITLTAKWLPADDSKVFEVSFDTDGGSAVTAQEVEENAKAVRPKNPTKEGFTFGGWYLGGSLYDFDKPVTADITLTAKWTENTAPAPGEDLLPTTIIFSDMAVGTYPEGTAFENGLITLKTGDWTVDENSGPITDAEGNSVSVTKRLKSVNVKSMDIDLSAYSGKVKVQFFVRTGNNNDLTRGVSLASSDGTVIDSLTLTASSMFTFEVTINCGEIYTLSTLVNGVNFYGINFIPVEE